MPSSTDPNSADPGPPPDDDSKAGLTLILNRALAGDAASRDRVYSMLYAELVRLARSHLSGAGQVSLNPSALVHEAYLRILRRDGTPMRDRRAFFAYASTAMRSVLVDHVRASGAEKRGGDLTPVTLTTGVLDNVAAEEDFSRLNEALDALRGVDERGFRVVEMRYFGGMTEEDIAGELAVSVPTVKRDWRKARAFLFEQLR
jgi:RNA polymerase sigma factor (TIGR02999 family)